MRVKWFEVRCAAELQVCTCGKTRQDDVCLEGHCAAGVQVGTGKSAWDADALLS